MATSPHARELRLSVSGAQLEPSFGVFQTPPCAAAMYIIVLLVGWNAIEFVLPEIQLFPVLEYHNPTGFTVTQLINAVGLFGINLSSGSKALCCSASW